MVTQTSQDEDASGAVEEFADLEYGDTVRYVGPDVVDEGWSTPTDYKQPFVFRHVTVGGVLVFLTKHNARRKYTPEHPCNNPDYWKRVEA